MKSLKALLVCAVFSMLCSCMAYGNVEMGKLAELDRVDITDKIKSESINGADITILGIYWSQNLCDYFEPCCQHVVFSPETLVTFDFSLSGEGDYKNSKNYLNHENIKFQLSMSFDFSLNKPVSKNKYANRFICGKFSDFRITYGSFEFKDYSMPNVPYTKDIIYEQKLFGPYNTKEGSFRYGFDAVCGGNNHNQVPAVLLPYYQNLIVFNSFEIENTMIAGHLREDPPSKLGFVEDFCCYIYAVLNSITLADGTIKTFNQVPINESEWLANRLSDSNNKTVISTKESATLDSIQNENAVSTKNDSVKSVSSTESDKTESTPVAPAVQNNNSSEGIPSIVPQMLELEP